jgi:hypothetical protein
VLEEAGDVGGRRPDQDDDRPGDPQRHIPRPHHALILPGRDVRNPAPGRRQRHWRGGTAAVLLAAAAIAAAAGAAIVSITSNHAPGPYFWGALHDASG